MIKTLTLFMMATLFLTSNCYAHDAAKNSATTSQDEFLLTVFLKHDQSKTLEQLQAELEETGFWQKFPPEGIEVVSWYVMMGIGQVVTLSVPPHRLREVNIAIEKTAWGAFRTEFYPSYDLSEVAKRFREKARKAK